MPVFDTNGPLGLTWSQWLAIVAIVAGSVLFGNILGRVVRAVVARLVKKTRSTWDDALLPRLAGPLSAALALALAAALIPSVGLPTDWRPYRLIRVGYFVVFFWTLFRLVDVGFHLLGESMWARSGPSRSLIPLGTRVAKVAIFAIAVVAVLSALGYPVASLIAGLGIGGLALALAAQKTVENLFGTFSIGADQPFREGDTVRIENFIANVEFIGLRSTRFRTPDRTVITIPNGKLAEMRLESLAVRDRLRFVCILPLVFETTEAQIREIIAGCERVLVEHPKTSSESAMARFIAIGPSSFD